MVAIYRLISFLPALSFVFLSCSKSYSPEDTFLKNDTLYFIETKTPFSGYIRTYYKNGKLKSVKEYKNGLAHGYYFRFYSNGQISLQMKYYYGKPLYFIQYYENSNIKAKTIDSAGLNWIFRYYENGTIFRKESLKNGLLHGIIYQYYENGKVHTMIQYEKGKKNGIFKMFFTNGKLKVESFYLNDSLHGIFKIWTEEGYYGEEFFKNGNRVGVWKYYYPNGKIKATVSFTNVGTIKERIEYNEEGKIIDKFVSTYE